MGTQRKTFAGGTMSRFPFATTERAQRFCLRVKEAIVIFSGKSENEAETLIAKFWAGQDDIEADQLLYHEAPYYYAMCIAHHPVIGDNQPDW